MGTVPELAAGAVRPTGGAVPPRPVPDRYGTDGWAAGKLAYKLSGAADALESGDGARTLAVRRATLTIGLDLAQCCDDSYGHVGEVNNDAIRTYAGTDWRAAGLAPEVFWADFLEILSMLANYGVASGQETELFRAAAAATDLDVLRDVAAGLHTEYTAARMSGHADAVQVLSVHALVAAAALEEFEAAARRLDPNGWRTWDAMVAAALEHGRVDVAARVLDAVDVPGRHEAQVRKRRAELAG